MPLQVGVANRNFFIPAFEAYASASRREGVRAMSPWRKHLGSGSFACNRATGLQSLPVVFGPDVAKWITVVTIDVTQLAVAAYLYLGLDEPVYAAVLLGLIIPQVPPSNSPPNR